MKQKKMNRHRKRLIKRLAAVGVAALVLVSTVSANSASYIFASDTSDTVVDESEELLAEDVQEVENADAEVVEEADEAEDIIVGEVLEDAEISEEAAEAETEETETVETEEADAEEEDAEVSAACIVPETTKPDTDTKDDTCEEPEKTCEAIEFDLAAYLTGTCTLTGTETNKEALALLGGSTFSFVATDVDGNKVATGLATPTTLNGWCDSITWTGSKLKYTEAGTYCYTIKQVIGCYPAVNYDTACYTLTVVVKNVCGVLTCCPTLTKCGVTVKCPTFKNCYNPESVTVNFDVTKILDGRYLIDGEFSFKLYQYASLTNLVNLECISKATAVTNVNGGAVFSKTYKSCGIYYYALTEEKPADAFDTMTYDTTVYYIKVVVIQGKDGKLQAYPYYSTDCGPVKCWKCLKTGSLTFTNTYRDTETIELTATKTLTGRDLAAGEFTFELTDEEGNTITAVNDADGTISFGEFTYDQSDIGKTYTYTVEEVAGDLDGVTYDAEAKTITVEITYNEESGQIEAAVTSDEVLFENTYEPSSDPEDPDPDPEPEPDPTTPVEPDPDPTEPTDPDPEPTEPTDPEDPEPEEPVEDDPVDPTREYEKKSVKV
ncbi:MAG: hypothetical protein LUD14_00355 [Clostridiales bacterium]|nr:hypothetical protein [Clostridiales bacterium]